MRLQAELNWERELKRKSHKSNCASLVKICRRKPEGLPFGHTQGPISTAVRGGKEKVKTLVSGGGGGNLGQQGLATGGAGEQDSN